MVQINKIEIQTVELFTPDNVSLGFVNADELGDVRIQIAREEVEGYYIVFNNEKIFINNKGELLKWPYGLFDLEMRQFAELYKIRKQNNGR